MVFVLTGKKREKIVEREKKGGKGGKRVIFFEAIDTGKDLVQGFEEEKKRRGERKKKEKKKKEAKKERRKIWERAKSRLLEEFGIRPGKRIQNTLNQAQGLFLLKQSCHRDRSRD